MESDSVDTRFPFLHRHGPSPGKLRWSWEGEVCCCLEGCSCQRSEGSQGVLTLFCSGAVQVCHDDRVEELREQLEVEEEDGDRQEEEVEEKGRSRIKEMRP